MEKPKREACRVAFALTAVFLSATAFAEPFPKLSTTNAPTEPAYAPAAFPAERRMVDRARLEESLAEARSRGLWTDDRLQAAFVSKPCDHLGRVRASKRRLLRTRALQYAARSLRRDDATGFGFAERALKDAEELDKLLEDEISLLAKEPSLENGAVVVDVREHGAKGDGVSDDAPAFARAGKAIRHLGGRPSILRIPAGVYRMASVQRCDPFTDTMGEYNCETGVGMAQCLFANLENCRIEGEGPTNTFIRCAVYAAPQLALVNCRNVTLAGVDLSLEQTPFLQGEVESFDPDARTCELSLKPGTLRPDHPGWTEPKASPPFGFVCGADGLIVPNGRLLPWIRPRPSEDLGNGRWRIYFEPGDDPDGWYWKHHVRNIRPGQTLVLPNRKNGLGAVSVRFCSFCTLEDVWVRNSRAWAFATSRSRATTFHRCRDVPQKGLLLSSNADGCWCEAGTVFLGCTFDSMGDDGINSLTYGMVTERGGTPHEVQTRDDGIRRGGDLAVFANPHTAQYLANLRIAQTDALVSRSNGWRRVTRFETPVPEACIGAFLYDPDRAGIGTVVSGCTFRNGRLAGNVVQTSTALYEDNVYFNVAEGIRIGALGDCQEGPPPYNVLVRGCRFERTSVGLTAWLRMRNAMGRGWSKVACAPIRGIEVRDNAFLDIPEVAVKFRHAGDCRFADNTFVRTARCWAFETCEELFSENNANKEE